MPPRSKIAVLPEDIRAELDRRLMAAAFGDYYALEDWLADKGFAISKSAIHKYGQELERKLEAVRASTQAAAALADAAPDDADLRSAAVMSLVQTDIFNVLVRLQEAGDETDPQERLKVLGRAAEGIATLSRASVAQKKWHAEVKAKVASAADVASKIARKGGLSAESVAEIRRQILGIAA